MHLYKFLFILIIANVSFSKVGKTLHPTPETNHITKWENEEKDIKNIELKKALEKLRNEFESERSVIQSAYKIQINDLKKNKDIDLDMLKNDFQAKRNSLKERYGVDTNKKPRKLKASKKDKLEINKPSKVKQLKSHINKDTPPEKLKDSIPASSTKSDRVDKK